MPLPIAHGLVGASIVAAALPDASPIRNWKLLIAGASLASAPDLDYFLTTSQHRSFTHSLLIALVIGIICFAIGGTANLRLALASSLAVLSHGLLDFAMTKTMPGVELFWPFSPRRFGLGLVDYYKLTGIDPTYFLTRDVASDLFKAVKTELIIFVPVFLFVLAIRWSLGNRTHS